MFIINRKAILLIIFFAAYALFLLPLWAEETQAAKQDSTQAQPQAPLQPVTPQVQMPQQPYAPGGGLS